ncbi:restriction endonuclease subunit S [Wenyingzhuangia sp. IMCC45574]
MAKKNKNPEVRFKGFTEDWKHLELGEFLDERKTMQKISKDAPILAFASGQGVIDRSERKSNNRDHLTLDQENKVYKLTELNDIVYNPSNLKYGAIDRNKHGRGVISPIYVTFTTEEEPSFIELIVKSEKFKLRALQYEEGTVVKRQSVSPENLLSLKVAVSNSLDEQKKIGRLFDDIEDLINKHQKKHDKLISIKNAMLEKMFPKNGAAIPEIRFKDYKEKWVQDTLEKLSDVYDGTHQTPKYTDKGIMFLSVENIKTLNSKKFISKKAFEDEFKIYPQKGDVLMTRIGDIGTTNVVETNEPRAYYVSLALLKQKKLDSYYLKECISSVVVQKDLWHRTLHIAFPKKINKNEIEKVNIPYPKSKNEQQKIGEIFKQINSLIHLHEVELEKLQHIKKACFTKMLVPQD